MMKPICEHPELRPTMWKQKKPEPCEMVTCACGQNASCPVCGFGWGGVPCGCIRPEVSLMIDRILDEHADIWKELAKV